MVWKNLRLEQIVYGLLVLLIFTLPLSSVVSSGVFYCAFLLGIADYVLHGRAEAVPEQVLPVRLKYCLWVLLLWSAASVTLSGDVFKSAYNWLWVVVQEAGSFWLVLRYGSKGDRPLYLLKALLYSAVLVALYGIYQYVGDISVQDPEWTDKEIFPELQRRAFSTLGNPNILGTFMVIVSGYCAGLFAFLQECRSKAAAAALFLLCAVTLLFTFSRGNWIAMVLAMLVFAGCFYRRALLPLAACGVVTLCLFWHVIARRIMSIFALADTSAELRFAYIEGTLAMIWEHPLGVGWYGYQFAFPDYDFYLMDPTVIMYHCHNLFLNVGSELGVLGLCLYLYILWLLLRYACELWCAGQLSWVRGVACGYVVAMAGICVSGLTDHTLFNIQLGTLFWSLSALMLGVGNSVSVKD